MDVQQHQQMRRNSTEGGDRFWWNHYPSDPYANIQLHIVHHHLMIIFMQQLQERFCSTNNQEEEQLQMQIALAESQREVSLNEIEKKIMICIFIFDRLKMKNVDRRNDDLKLKIALERSVNESSPDANNSQVNKIFLNYISNIFFNF